VKIAVWFSALIPVTAAFTVRMAASNALRNNLKHKIRLRAMRIPTMIPRCPEPVPYLTTHQMREVDRLMIEEYQIQLIQMMENAGRHLAALARERFLKDDPRHRQVVVLAGTGGNGGGALVCARWLHNAGADVQVYLTAPPDKCSSVPAHQLDILYQMGVNMMLSDGNSMSRIW
jgi:hypothetical protein